MSSISLNEGATKWPFIQQQLKYWNVPAKDKGEFNSSDEEYLAF